MTEAIGSGGLGTYVGMGLVAVGAYLLLSRFVPGAGFVGSMVLLATGIALLWRHLERGAGTWALYAGAVLTGIGGSRVVIAILPVRAEGLTAVGIGISFLVIAYLREARSGGTFGWQFRVGVVALGYGLLEFALGLVPGSPDLLDLVVPIALIVVGAAVLHRVLRSAPT